MNASFTATDASRNPLSLEAAANACGFAGFDWVQKINQSLGGVFEEDTKQELRAPPSFFDPPPSGYTFDFPCASPGNPPDCDQTGLVIVWLKIFRLNFANAFPFYYSPLDILSYSSSACPSAGGSCCAEGYRFQSGCQIQINSDADFLHVPGDFRLNFWDRPANMSCPPPTSPPSSCFAFTTELVGICNNSSTSPACGPPQSPNPYPSVSLYHWNWYSNYNNSTNLGGVLTSSYYPSDDSSGTGGITLTSLNGVPQTPPSVSCTATPGTLWPPDGKPADVAVFGTVTAGTQEIPVGGTTYAVTDKYGLVQPSGGFTADAGGSYSFTVPLIAARDGNDLSGRTYTVNVIAADQIGNVGSCSAVVTVPHDQGN